MAFASHCWKGSCNQLLGLVKCLVIWGATSPATEHSQIHQEHCDVRGSVLARVHGASQPFPAAI